VLLRRIYDIPALYDQVIAPGPCEPFYSNLARQCRGDVLELACGTGRLTIPISLRGHRITALDSSLKMLDTAKRKAQTARAKIDFRHADMRSFELDRRFSLIMVSCNSLAHMITQDDLLSCLRQIKRHLGPNGLFAFDIINPEISSLAECVRQKMLDFGARSPRILIEESAFYDPVRQVRTSQWHIQECPGSRYRLKPLELRMIFPQELLILLKAVGLNLVARYGDFSRAPFGASSLNQICLAA
jgi:2-polyprenyl-3-methyl-5-hydroxy-6-metoxy-1,4-benzoquinol methylase